MTANRLTGRVAFVTGAASGIGAAIAQRLHRDGASVILADQDMERCQEMASKLGEERTRAILLDVSNPDAWISAMDSCAQVEGKLDILVNNAGIALPALPVQETALSDFDNLVGVNLRGVFLGCKFAYPLLLASRGCVLNISSMAGVTGQASHAIYAATKGGINALTKSTAVDWGKKSIRINALCPAGVRTAALDEWIRGQSDPLAIEEYLRRIHCLGYCPEASEIADVAAFLVSDDAKFITGCIMPVSGGSECGYNLEK